MAEHDALDLVGWLDEQITADERRMAPQMDQGAALTPPLVPEYPARVLAECEAKRRIIGRWRTLHDDEYLMQRHNAFELRGYQSAYYQAIKFFALPYKDRPGYREEWAP